LERSGVKKDSRARHFKVSKSKVQDLKSHFGVLKIYFSKVKNEELERKKCEILKII
jgi:hypothetical protein